MDERREDIIFYGPDDTYSCCLVHSRDFGPTHTYPFHSHNFGEIVYIDYGVVKHQVNGKVFELNPGDLVLLRPNDNHQLKALDRKKGFLHINITFTLETLKHIKNRYFRNDPHFYGGDAKYPLQFTLSLDQREWLKPALDTLARYPRHLFKIERFLLDLFHELSILNANSEFAGGPQWLREAYQLIHEPQHFAKGTQELARLADRSPIHVTRELKRHLGKTAIEVVNEARLNYAGHQLVMSNKKINEIAAECGFDSPAHFHHIFRKHFDTTPRHYRMSRRGAGTGAYTAMMKRSHGS